MYGLSALDQGERPLRRPQRHAANRTLQDRSLGVTELHVSDLAVAAEDTLYPYESTGTKEYAEQLRLNKGGQFKGTLHYHAQFIPAMKLKGVKFDASETLKPGDQASSASSSDVEEGEVSDRGETDDEHFVPVELTHKPKRRKTKDLPKIQTTDENGAAVENGVQAKDFAASPETAAKQLDDADTASLVEPMSAVSGAMSFASTTATTEGVEIPPEELLKHRTFLVSCTYWICTDGLIAQNLVSSSSTSSPATLRRRAASKCSWMTVTGHASALPSLAQPTHHGTMLARDSSRKSTLDRCGCVSIRARTTTRTILQRSGLEMRRSSCHPL